ncbi:hypothetical protein BpHYR1_038268 [Brachionus plicatilis]|uniref:Uncharacterized protein n=1 Tax=Brachionus plicatilis TaxID=10195 RepID=A0A3M7RFZ4_BRAPC|nr:hypothetical protein BpHYR1_038268 [Brachionus plicatilis]
MIDLIELNDWNIARKLWLTYICKIDFDNALKIPKKFSPEICNRNKIYLSTFGNEFEFFFDYLIHIQKIEVIKECSNALCGYKSNRPITNFYFEKKDNEIMFSLTRADSCNSCLNPLKKSLNILTFSPWLFVETKYNEQINYDSLPEIIELNQKKYKFLCCTIHLNQLRDVFKILIQLQIQPFFKFKPELKLKFHFYFRKSLFSSESETEELFNISFSNKNSTNCDIREMSIVIILLERKLQNPIPMFQTLLKIKILYNCYYYQINSKNNPWDYIQIH